MSISFLKMKTERGLHTEISKLEQDVKQLEKALSELLMQFDQMKHELLLQQGDTGK